MSGIQRIARVALVSIVLVQAWSGSALRAEDPCSLRLLDTFVTDNGDGDGFADTDETLQIGITLQPRCDQPGGVGLGTCVARLSTESPAIDCMRRPEILVGYVPGTGPAVTSEETFEIKIGAVDRSTLGLGSEEPLEAHLSLEIDCSSSLGETTFVESIVLPLDLNVSDLGQSPVEWKEDFEGSGGDPANPLLGTAFFAENLDEGMPGNSNAEGLTNADGWRCQYNDPDWWHATSYNRADAVICYPGANLSHANAVFWQVDGSLVPDSPDGGRAFRGEKSMYYGVFLGLADEGFTTPLSTVESVATLEPINLGAESPRLSFWQQVSLADHRSVSTRGTRSVDRGVIQIKLYDEAGLPTSDWMNLQPLKNAYAQQAESNYYNCTFDPTDDGNNEDDYFDPADPDRELGPSSTCFPEFSWAWMGSTTGTFPFNVLGHATWPPGSEDAPSLGQGTWIESTVDLTEFRGRRARLRYLVTSIKTYAETYVLQFGSDMDERDDGWWIDEIVIDEVLSEPAVFSNDEFLLGSCTGAGEACIGQCSSSFAPCSEAVACAPGAGECVSPCPAGEVCTGLPPDCGVDCTIARVNLFVVPGGPANPASVVMNHEDDPLSISLSAPANLATGAEPSWLDACIDGYREFRACASGDPDGSGPDLPDTDCDDVWDRPVCESCSISWSHEFMLSLSPEVATTYAAEVRCSSVPSCRDGSTMDVVVECTNGNPNTLGLREMRALDEETLAWQGTLDVDWMRGSFSTGAEIGNYLPDFTGVASSATSIPMDGVPPVGTGFYYLVKEDGPTFPFQVYQCDTRTWRGGGDAEVNEPARNSALGDP